MIEDNKKQARIENYMSLKDCKDPLNGSPPLDYTNDVREFQLEVVRRIKEINKIEDINEKLRVVRYYEQKFRKIRGKHVDWSIQGLIAKIIAIREDLEFELDHYNQVKNTVQKLKSFKKIHPDIQPRFLLYMLYSGKSKENYTPHEYINFISEMSSKYKKERGIPKDRDFSDQQDFTFFITCQVEQMGLIERAQAIIEKNYGVLYRASIGILKAGLRDALEKQDFTDLIEYVPKYEKKYVIKKKDWEEAERQQKEKRIEIIKLRFSGESKKKLIARLAKCEKRSEEYHQKWTKVRRPDERTQWKAKLSNSIDSNARELLLIKDAMNYFYPDKNIHQE